MWDIQWTIERMALARELVSCVYHDMTVTEDKEDKGHRD